MRLHVELEDGKSETVFIPAAAMRDAQLLDDELDGADLTIFLGWWAFHKRGLTDIDNHEEFGHHAYISPAPGDDDPKA